MSVEQPWLGVLRLRRRAYSEFEDEATLKAYADHPAHLKVREDLRDVRTARYQVDYIADRNN